MLPLYTALFCIVPFCLKLNDDDDDEDFRGKGSSPCQYIDTTRKAIDCATTLRLTFLYSETLQQTFRPVLSKLPKRRQI